MKILLVSPLSKAGNGGFLLGLAYISSVLKKHGFTRIHGLDLMYQSESLLYELARDADFVGFYCTTRTFEEVERLASAVKQLNRRITVAVGGPHPTLFPDQVIGIDAVDLVGIGEGEFIVLEIIQKLDRGDRDFTDVTGIYWKKEGLTIKNTSRKTFWKLDTLPFPDWDLFDHSNYYSGLATPIASRGCPFRCANCMPALKKIAGPFRMRSVANVVAELKYLNTRYGFDHFFFQDNDMAVNKKWLQNLCAAIMTENLKIRWHALCRVTNLDPDLLREMKRSGCSHINIGAESGSQRVVSDILKKGIHLTKVKDVVAWCNRQGLESTVFFMIGIPGETLAEMRQTIQFAAGLEADDLMISVSQPVPMTDYERMCQKNGWLLTDNPNDLDTPDSTGGMRCWIKTDTWGPQQVNEIKEELRHSLIQNGFVEIDNRLLFRNFNRILQKRDWKYLQLMVKEEIRKMLKQKSLKPLYWAGLYVWKKLQTQSFRNVRYPV